MKIRTDLTSGQQYIRGILTRELGRGIGLFARGPSPYAMGANGIGYTGTTYTFHHDEWKIIGLTYGLPLFTVMDYYLTND